jgi:tetratricopeptide (TPR) repeat protein
MAGQKSGNGKGADLGAEYSYNAFISYRHLQPDRTWAKWLHRSLETYRPPRRLCKSHGLPKRLQRCFRDEDELSASAHLTVEIEKALRASRNLIVVCSPRTPQSQWVRREIALFREWGRAGRILALLIEGEPRQAFPEELYEIRPGIGADEPLAADVRPSDDESLGYRSQMAKLRLLATILGVKYDDLRRREQERKTRNARIYGAMGFLLAVVIAVVAYVGISMRSAKIEAMQMADAARTKADAAETERWRSVLEGYHSQTDAHLAKLRALRNATDRPDIHAEILAAIRQVGALHEQALGAVGELSDRGQLLGDEERRWWEQQANTLRNEATRALTGIRLQRGRSVPLPEGPNPTAMPAIAVRADRQQVAAVYPGTTTVLVLGLDGEVLHRLRVPDDFAAKTLTTSTMEHGWRGEKTANVSHQTAPATLSFPADNRLEYHVGQEALCWTLPDARPRREPRTRSAGSQPFNASTDRYLATRTALDSAVKLCDWSRDAQPQVVWQNRKQDNDSFNELMFGSDGRALFIRSTAGLSLVDAATGATASENWPTDQRTKVEVGNMVPCRLGVAMVERRTVDGRPAPAQLVFWHAMLPQVEMRVLHHDEPPTSLDGNADGLLLSGAPDHLVRAWRGRKLQWVAGIPYVASPAKNTPRGWFPSVDFSAQDVTFSPGLSTSLQGQNVDWRRYMWTPSLPVETEGRRYWPPDPYPTWDFLREGSQSLLVTRRELLPGGRSQDRTELHSVEDGRSVYAFPNEGNGRLWESSGISPDYRFALTVADERDGRGSLAVWSLGDRRLLGRLDRPIDLRARLSAGGLLPFITFVSSPSRDWLLASYPRAVGTSVDLEIWRLPDVRLVGTLQFPRFHTGALLTRDGRRASVFGGNRWYPPQFCAVVDLETAQKVCDLEETEFLPEGSLGIVFNGQVDVSASQDVLSSDPYRVFAWDLTTGKRRELGKKLWTNARAPKSAYNPGGDRLILCGNLHDSGMAHLELWTLPDFKLLQEATFPTTAIPWVADIQGTHCTIELDDFPEKDKRRFLHWRWADGQELFAPPTGAAKLVGFVRDLRNDWKSLLWWRAGTGLALQQGTDKPLVPLQNTGDLNADGTWGLSPNGKVMAFTGARGGFWDAATGREIARLAAADVIYHLPSAKRSDPKYSCFDPTGRWAMTVNAARGEISVWDLETEKVAHRCRPRQSADPPFDPARDLLKLHPNGKRLAVLSRGVLRLWDLEHNRQVLALDKPGHFTPVACVAQHPGTGLVASGDAEGVILLWNRKDGRLRRTLFAPGEAVVGLAFSPDGRRLAAMAEDGISLADLDGHVVWTREVPQPKTFLAKMLFHPGGGFLLAGTADGRLLVIDAKTGRYLADKTIDPSGVSALALSPDGTLLAVGGRSGQVHLWDVARREPRSASWDSYSPVGALTFVDGNDLLAVGGGRSIQFVETSGGRLVWTLEITHGPVRSLLLDDRSGELAVADSSENVVIFNLPHLLDRLEGLKLGIPEFPHGKWPLPKEPAPPVRHTWQDWQQKADRYRDDHEVAAAVWAYGQASLADPGQWQPLNALGEILDHAWGAPTLQGERASARSACQNAVNYFSKALVLRPDDWQIWRNRAQVYARLHDWPKALDDFTQAIAIDAKQAQLWHGRGLVCHALRRYDEAIADFDHALQLDPKLTDAAVQRAEALRWKGQYNRAIADLGEVLRQDPHAAKALAVRSAAYRGKAELDPALADANEAIRFQPDLAFAFTQRGEIYRQKKQYELALADFDEAVALDPEYPNPHLARGIIYAAQKQFARAIVDILDAIRQDPDNSVSYMALGDIQVRRREFEAAIACYDQAVRRTPLNPLGYCQRGEAKFQKGDYRGAVADYDEAIRLQPDLATAYLGRGIVESLLQQEEKALVDYEKAATLSPKWHLPWFNRGRLCFSRGDYDKAIACFSQAIELKGDYLDSLRGRANAYAELGQWEKAVADFSAAVRLAPGDPADQYRRAYAMLGSGAGEKCRAANAEMLKTFHDTRDPRIVVFAALSGVLVSGAAEDPRPYLEMIEKLGPAASKSYEATWLWGAALYRCGRFEEAAQKLAAAAKLKAGDGAPFDVLLLALVYAKSGRAVAARICLDKATPWIEHRCGAERHTPDQLAPWQVRLELLSLRREAEELLKPAGENRPKTAQ